MKPCVPAVTPLSVFAKAPRVEGIEQLKASVKVNPVQEFATVLTLEEVPIES